MRVEPEALSVFLAGDHPAAVQLRDALRLEPQKIDPSLITDALAMPPGYICGALFSALARMGQIVMDPETVLIARLRHVKRSVLVAWEAAMRFAAPSGYLTADDARRIGIGELVFEAMTAQCGKTPIEALSVREFLRLAPELIAFLPITEEGLQCLSHLLSETRDFIQARLDGELALTSEAATRFGSCR